MSDPLGNPLPRPLPNPHGAEPSSDDDEVNLLDGSAEPTDDSPTVISKAPPPDPRSKPEADFSGGLRGRRLAHFELIEPIGVGGMAAVLRARDTQLDRQVALKILPPEMASDPENVRRFHQEARSAARLDHENIARVFFCGEDQRLHFIAFEFVEGENLRTILEKRGRLPVSEALNYMLQVAAGLAHAAGRGVVHRDIKPSNIIITPNGRAKLVDMGLARSLEPQHDLGLTHSGVTLGTFDYISPEQALEPRDADVRSDIYSLGCTFYHMLTGHAPVPEGTAAKKLHHHQHVKPPDPRQFVPELPAEAAIILDRMMAKLPKDRYQTPEHLVHHLYLAARKLGAAAEVPEGVLAVEAALPSPPTSRPYVLAALAAIAVVGLIFLLDQFSTPTPSAAPQAPTRTVQDNANKEEGGGNPVAQPAQDKKDGPKEPVMPPLKESKTPVVFDKENPTAADLAEFLQKHKDAHEIDLKLDDLDLRAEDRPELVIANPIVTIRPRTPGKRPTIRDEYRGQYVREIRTSFTIQSKICTIEGIRFVLDQTNAAVPMTSLRLRDTQKARISRCEFIQVHASGSEARMTSVLAQSKEPASLSLTGSCFLGFATLETTMGQGLLDVVFNGAASGGQDAVTRRGPVALTTTNCLFGPHAADFRLEGAATDEEGLVRVEHTSVLLGNRSAVFEVADRADARITVNSSLFSRPGEPGMAGMAESVGAVLLRQPPGQETVRFEGRHNRYHQLDSYWIVSDSGRIVQDRRDDLKQKDVDSHEQLGDPWNDPQPLKRLEALSLADSSSAIQAAFHVNFHLPALRLEGGEDKLVGAEKALAFSYVDRLPSLNAPVGPEGGRRELVVDERAKPEDAGALLYQTLSHALLDARPGDVIRLRLNGEQKIDPLSGDRLTDLTIRADRGFHPVLTLSDKLELTSAALFNVSSGRLRLENLEVRLRRRSQNSDPQSVVYFLGEAECVLKDCLITLDRAGAKTSLAVLPEKLKMKPKSGLGARLSLLNCFVRGQGNLICSQGGQLGELTLRNSLIALTGSLLSIESDKEADRETPAASFTLHLRKSTTYLGEHLIRLRAAKDLRSVAKVQCEPENCLFLPAGDRALVHLEGPEGERGLMDKLSWGGRGGKNAYGLFTTLLEQQSVGGMMEMMPQPSNLDAWKNSISGESTSEYNIKPTGLPAVDTLAEQLPPAFRTTDKALKDYGADLAALGALPVLRDKIDAAELGFDFPDFDSD
jgi:hypothetical protein